MRAISWLEIRVSGAPFSNLKAVIEIRALLHNGLPLSQLRRKNLAKLWARSVSVSQKKVFRVIVKTNLMAKKRR